jgi:serine/threonine protein kinase
MARSMESARTLMVGTPDYMAPELLTREPMRMLHPDFEGSGVTTTSRKYDAAAVDVWSCGAVLYTVVAGVFPFEHPSKPSDLTVTLLNLRRGEYRALPPDCSPELVGLIARCFQVDPAKRITLEQLRTHPWVTERAPQQPGSPPLVARTPARPGGNDGLLRRACRPAALRADRRLAMT